MDWFLIALILFVLNGGLLFGVGKLSETFLRRTADRFLLWRGVLLLLLLAPLYGVWFHLFLNWTIRKVRFYRECVVDRKVIATGIAEGDYLRCLIRTAARQKSKAAAPALLFGGSELRGRIESLLKEASMSLRPSRTHLGLIVSVLAIGAVASNTLFPLTPLGATGAQSAEELKMEELDENPKPISRTIPGYTEEAIKAGIEGVVLLNCLIDADGFVKDCEVKQGLGYGLEEAAMREIGEKWRFEPGRKDGSPVSVRATIEISFKLRQDSEKDEPAKDR